MDVTNCQNGQSDGQGVQADGEDPGALACPCGQTAVSMWEVLSLVDDFGCGRTVLTPGCPCSSTRRT